MSWGHTMMSHGLKTKREELEVDNGEISTAALIKTNPLHCVFIHVFFCPEATINDTYWHCQIIILHWVMSSCLDLALHTQMALNMPKWDWNQGPGIPPNPVCNFCTAQMDYITMWLNETGHNFWLDMLMMLFLHHTIENQLRCRGCGCVKQPPNAKRV